MDRQLSTLWESAERDRPWTVRAVRFLGVLVLVLLFQVVSRGEATPSIALLVAGGYVVVAEAVGRFQ